MYPYISLMSQIRGSLTQAAAAQVTWPLGQSANRRHEVVFRLVPFRFRKIAGFDFAPLNAKEFYRRDARQADMNEVDTT